MSNATSSHTVYIPCTSFGADRKTTFPSFFSCGQCDNYEKDSSLNPYKILSRQRKHYKCISKHISNVENTPTQICKPTFFFKKQRFDTRPAPIPTPTPITESKQDLFLSIQNIHLHCQTFPKR